MVFFFCQSNYTGSRQTAEQKSPKNTISAMGGYAQIWDVFTWLTLVYEYLSTWAPLRWEKKNYSKQNETNCTRDVG